MISGKLIAIGISLGGVVGFATQEYALWLSLGVALGLAMDAGKKMKTKSQSKGI